MRRLALIAALILLAAPQARADNPVPGDTCTAGQANYFNLNGLYPNTGFVNGMFCNGSNWLGVINFQSTGKVGIANTSPGALLDIGTATSTLGTVRLEGNTSGYVQLQPAAAAGSWTMTMPTGTGSNGQVLTTNGAGVTSWATASSSMTLISTQTASGGADIQFTNLPSTYNTLFLSCSGLTLDAARSWNLVYGEGAGPTWEYSTAKYRYFGLANDGTPSTYNDGGGQFTMALSAGTTDVAYTSGYSSSISGYIYQVGSSSLYKMAQITTTYFRNSDKLPISWRTAGTWTGDKNPITAIMLYPWNHPYDAINSGTCSLYGMN